MLGNDFTYGEYSLSDFDMKMYDPDDEQQFVRREIDKSEITSVRPMPNHYSTHYADVLELHFFIVKDTDEYLTQEEMRMTANEVNNVRAWFESPKTPTMLSVESENENDNTDDMTYYFGIFTDVEPFIIGQECFGLYLTFTCNSPYGFSEIKESTYTLGAVNILAEDGTNLLDESDNAIIGEGGTGNFTYSNTSAEHKDYLRPIVKISSTSTFGANEQIQIKNVTDGNKIMLLSLPKGKSYITIDCQKKKITDNNGKIIPLSDIGLTLPISDDYNFVSAELYTFYWLRLLSGTNNLNISCQGSNSISNIKISARHIRKSGGF